MTPSVIAIFDSRFGVQLHGLAGRAPIWIIQSGENNAVVAELRKAGHDISTFLPGTLLDWMSVIDEHHPNWSVIEVYGQKLSPDVMDMLREYGDGRFESAQSGFRFVRSSGAER